MKNAKYLLGLDIGSSSVKALLVNVEDGSTVAATQSPAEEMQIFSPQSGWAEQDPEMWWSHSVLSIKSCLKKAGISPSDVCAIGISYQMHGLVIVGKDHKPLRSSIIWCDSRAAGIGDKALSSL